MKKTLIFGVIGVVLVGICSCGNPCKDGHTWTNANPTCVVPKICSVCEETEGEPLGHNFGEYTVVTEATCAAEGKQEAECARCGSKEEQSIPKKEHTEGVWQTIIEPTADEKGRRQLLCSVCGESIRSETFTLSPEELKNNYISKCSNYTYNEISRNPDAYKGKYAALRGKVIQVMEDGDDYTLRVNITKGKYVWDDTILVTYTKKSASESRILDDDIVNIYGMLGGTYTYETVMGSSLTVPILYAEYIDL